MTAQTLTATFAVGQRYRVTLSAPTVILPTATEIRAEWEPHPPRTLSAAEWQDYRDGRDDFLRELSARIGGRVACIEI